MSGRIFQNVVLQFKETTDRTIGVIDADGTVIACSELTGIGKKWSKYVEPIAAAEGACITLEGRTFKALPSWGPHFDYAVFASGDDSMSRTVCSMAAVSLNAAKSYYEEKHDKGSFIKNIISDNILISDIYMRAKELHVPAETARGVFVVRPVDERLESVPVDVIQGMFPDRQNDFVISIGEQDVALIHQMDENATGKDLEAVARRIEEALREDGESRVFVGIGTLTLHLNKAPAYPLFNKPDIAEKFRLAVQKLTGQNVRVVMQPMDTASQINQRKIEELAHFPNVTIR